MNFMSIRSYLFFLTIVGYFFTVYPLLSVLKLMLMHL